MPNLQNNGPGHPHDASEYMIFLFNAFESDTLDSRLFSHRISILEPTEETKKKLNSEAVTVKCSPENPILITMSVLEGWQKEKKNIVIEQGLQNVHMIEYKPQNHSESFSYIKKEVFTDLPDQLLLYINRCCNPDKDNFDPIELNERGYVSLPLTKESAMELVDYRIISCTKNTNASHYVHVQRKGDGFIVHDDATVYSQNASDSSILRGNIFYLERVKSS